MLSYTECVRCVMDVSARQITFSDEGFCNYCTEFLNKFGNQSTGLFEQTAHLEETLRIIMQSGRGAQYDCVIGVSGGVDSSYVLVKAREVGLRPLAVHMDNGWNSELAQHNISNLVRKLKVDLETVVVRWSEYRSLMQAFFDANVIDIELLYDNAAIGAVRKIASKHRIKFALNGTNLSTEGLQMPRDWNWYKSDARNIKAIARRSGMNKTVGYPYTSTLDVFRDRLGLGLNTIPYLDLVGYNKQHAINTLTTQFGFKPYPYKHYESVFTRFYQGYILPEKFGVDKRRHHLSNLIMTSQITREEAIRLLAEHPYPEISDLYRDRNYFLKKMNWSEVDLNAYLKQKERSHYEFANERKYLDLLYRLKNNVF